MATINLTNQAQALSQFNSFKTQVRNQMLARKPFLDKLSPEQLKKLYQAGKDPLLNAVFDMYKDLDAFFVEIRGEV